MTLITNLGERLPCGLKILIAEGLLPHDPPPSSFSSVLYGRNGEADSELVTCAHAVVWSRGGTTRRLFRFAPATVKHALLTTFLAGSPEPAKEPRPQSLVVVLDHQLHAYTLDGSAHVLTVPFEVDKAFAVPRGILLQRKIARAPSATRSPQTPAAPPNSFFSSQQALRHSSSHSPPSFVSNPRDFLKTDGTVSGVHGLLDNTRQPIIQEPPRLLVLTDPEADFAPVVETADVATAIVSPNRLSALDEQEDVLYVSEAQRSFSNQARPLTVVVSSHKHTGHLTIWNAIHIDDDAGDTSSHLATSRNRQSLRRSMRRSSQHTRLSTGTSTPNFRQSEHAYDALNRHAAHNAFPAPSQTLQSRPVELFLMDDSEDPLGPHTQPDIGLRPSTKRSTRRASSMMARAELSSQEPHIYGDIARVSQPPGQSFLSMDKHRQSLRGAHERVSFGWSKRLSGRASTPASVSLLSDVEEAANTEDEMDALVSARPLASRKFSHPSQVAQKSKGLIFVRAFSLSPGDFASTPQFLSDVSRKLRFVFKGPANESFHPDSHSLATLLCFNADVQRAYSISMQARLAQFHGGSKTSVRSPSHEGWRAPVLTQQYSVCLIDQPFDAVLGVDDRGMQALFGISHQQIPYCLIRIDGQHHYGLRNSEPLLAIPLPTDSQIMHPTRSDSRAAYHGVAADCLANGRIVLGNATSCTSYMVKLGGNSPHTLRVIHALDHGLRGIDYCNIIDIFSQLRCQAVGNSIAEEPVLVVVAVLIVLLRITHKLAGFEGSLEMLKSLPRNTVSGSDYVDTYIAAFCAQTGTCRSVAFDPDSASQQTYQAALRNLLMNLHCLWAEEQVYGNRAVLPSQPIAGHVLANIALLAGVEVERYRIPHAAWERSQEQSSQCPAIHWVSFQRDTQEIMQALHGLLNFACSNPVLLSTNVSLPHAAERLASLNQYLYNNGLAGLNKLGNTMKIALELQHCQSKGNVLDGHAINAVNQSEAVQCITHRARAFPMTRVLEARAGTVRIEKRHAHIFSAIPEGEVASRALKSKHQSLADLMANFEESCAAPSVTKATEGSAFLRQVFREDRRWYEAARLVDPLRVAVTTIVPGEGMTEAAFLDALKARAQLVYQRTMALPSGQAIMRFGASRPVLTEKIKINTFNTTCNMQPSNNAVNADKSNFTEEKVGWAFFHAGVNAGLHISRESTGIDTSWLVLNKPTELGNRHAGLLLALGLNGHLRKIAKWLAFKYLTAKHTMTSVGLLLGMAASSLGSMDSLITRLLSVHVARMLPPGAAELNLSPLTQTAGIMSVGLLYYESQHRRMSEIMLSEIEHVELNEDDGSAHEAFRDEGYRLAAAFALGLINLGRGKDLSAVHDLLITERLLAVATGPREISTVHILDQAAAGATVAIALIFLKTGDKSVAREIDIPSTTHQYDAVRPDILLLRTVARWLIMWDDIDPSVEWVKKNSPKEWRHLHAAADLDHTVLDSTTIPFYNILAGLCWAIALKYAGSSHQGALDVLQHYFKIVSSILSVTGYSNTFDRSLTRDTLLRWQHVLALSMATICAGTGNIEVLRILRAMHEDVLNKTFGFHQATHMAIGLLFMGQGRFTLGTSRLAVAAMLMAFYPVFPKDILDNRAHLQALRHFWVLAAEPRCLVARDSETHEVVIAPIKIIRKDGHGPTEREAPCLLPELDKIQQVEIHNPNYFPVILDFAGNKEDLQAFMLHQTVTLSRKPLALQQPDLYGATLAVVAARTTTDHPRQGSMSIAEQANDWLFDLETFKKLSVDGDTVDVVPLQSGLLLDKGFSHANASARVRTLLDADTTPLDDLLVLAADTESDDRSKMMGLRCVLEDSSVLDEPSPAKPDRSQTWLRKEWKETLRSLLLHRARILDEGEKGNDDDDDDDMIIDV